MRSGGNWFTRPPRTLRRPGIRLDNVALVPASLLPNKKQWQQIANGLSKDGVLIILPSGETPPRKTLQTVGALLTAHGHRVTTIPAQSFK